MYKLLPSDLAKLKGVDPKLVLVVMDAQQDFPATGVKVLEGVRTIEKQRQYVARGASRTMKSRHLVQPDGYGHAVDIVPLENGKVSWKWPLFWPVVEAMKKSAARNRVAVEHGAYWKSFPDGPHHQT